MMDTQKEDEQSYEEEEENSKQSIQKPPKNSFNKSEINDIQYELQEMTKKIEHEKINLRICQERYEKKFITYSELQGRPVPLTKEEKEKEKAAKKKKKKNHSVADPIEKKKPKDKEMIENQGRILRESTRNEGELGALTNEINELVLSNQAAKEEIKDLRKQKNIALNQRDKTLEDNQRIQDDIDELREKNKESEGKIKNRELSKSMNQNQFQKKEFAKSRDDLEGEYHKIIEENIKREREQKKEQAKKRQMLSMVSDSKAVFKGANAIELEKQVKALKAEEISDRTPITEELLSKWKYINKVKKYMIEKYEKNSASIRKAFDHLLLFLGIDDYEDLPIVYRKAVDQLSNIEMYLSQLVNECDNLRTQKEILKSKIAFLSDKKKSQGQDKTSFIEDKQNIVDKLTQNIQNVEEDIEKKRNLFKRIQPGTDDYLLKLNETYLSEYVPDKCQIDKQLEYNEKSVTKFISSVEEYYLLIQMFQKSMEEKKKGENNEIDRLRNEIRMKLERFKRENLIDNNLCNSMKLESKNGVNFEDIIKRSSDFICTQINSSDFFKKKTIRKKKLDEIIDFKNTLCNCGSRYDLKLIMLLQLYTAVRPNEARLASWSEFNLEKGTWTIPSNRMKMRKPHEVVLSKQILKALKDFKKLKEQNNKKIEGYCFKNQCDKTFSAQALLKMIEYAGYGLKISAHGLRGTFATIANELRAEHGFRNDIVQACLAHETQNEVASAYNHAEYKKERATLLQWWADKLGDIDLEILKNTSRFS